MEQAVVITYETLYETWRRERDRADLQKLDDNFFNDVLEYLREKQKAHDDALGKNDIFSKDEREKLHIQLANIRKILNDIYSIRENKIIHMAMNKSRTRTSIIDTSTLLTPEKSLFESINTILNHHRRNIVNKITELREPDIAHTEKQTEEQQKTQETKQLCFKGEVEQFVDEELNEYGPFKADEQAEIPNELAEVLISQGKAEEVKN